MLNTRQIKRAGLEEALRQMPVGIVVVEAPSGEIAFLNDRAREMAEWCLGGSSSRELRNLHDVYGSGGFVSLRPDGRPYREGEWPLARSIRDGEEVRDEEITCRGPTGDRFVVRCDSSPIYDVRGRIAAGVLVMHDLTGQKRADEALEESNRRTENVLGSITDAFYAMDPRWRFTYLNERAVRFASELAGEEFTQEGLLGRTLWETLPAVVGTSIEEEYRRALGEQKTVVFEYPYPGDGPTFEVHAYPSEGGLSVYFQDITERKRAEREIETRTLQQAVVAELGLWALAEKDLSSLMNNVVDLVADTLGVEYAKIVELLPGDGATGSEKLLLSAGVGWREGVLGGAFDLDPQTSHTLTTGEPVVFEDLGAETRFPPARLLLEHGVVSGVTVVIPGRDGPFGVMGAHTSSRRVFPEDDANFLQAVANVLAMRIERERADEKLQEVREAERSRIARDLHDEALQDLAHAMTQAQHAEGAPYPKQLVGTLKRVERRIRGAVYDLRLGGEQDKTFGELLESLLDLHRSVAPGYEIGLDLGDDVLPGPVDETGRELLRIAGEALTNARRHSGRPCAVRVSVRSQGGILVAEVADDGQGFGVQARGPSETGGMGLKGMRERARALGGNLEVRSAPGEGTKVRFEMGLPAEKEAPGQVARVLLVEDHATVREAVSRAFEAEAGFEVVGEASSLSEARRMLEEGPVDVAILDLGLPDGFGADLIKDLRAANPNAQALVLSASMDRAEIAGAVENGAAGVLHKTAHLAEVVDAARKLGAGETILPLEEVVELLRFAGSKREREYEAQQTLERLTPREREVLQALAGGLDSAGIAERLSISVRTERNHMASILAKLGVHSQLQALVFALRHGVVEIS